MNQNIAGITSSLKKNIKNLKTKSNQNFRAFKPKNIKAQIISKENPISPQTSFRIPLVEESQKEIYHGIVREVKNPIKSIKNQHKQKIILERTKNKNVYLVESLGANSVQKRANQQAQQIQKRTLNLKKKDKNKVQNQQQNYLNNYYLNHLQKSVKPYQQFVLEKKEQLQSDNGNKLQQFTSLSENKKLYSNEYTKKNQDIKFSQRLQAKRIGRPKRALSSSSSTSNKSYYKIIAQYRKKRINSIQLSQGKYSLNGSIDGSDGQMSQNLINKVKSQKSILFNPKGVNLNRQNQGVQGQICSSAASKSSNNSRSRFYSFSKNPFQQKVKIMKDHLKLRKNQLDVFNSRINNLNKMINIDKRIQANILKCAQTSCSKNQFQESSEYKASSIQKSKSKSIHFLQAQLEAYKEKYQKSLSKINNVEKQLEIQKKKNQITKQLYKSEIQKLKRAKSSESIQYNDLMLSQSQKFVEQQQLSQSQKQNNQNFSYFKEKNKNSQAKQSLDMLISGLKSSHLYTYQDYSGIVYDNKLNFRSCNNEQTSNSILKVPQLNRQFQNHSQDMIIELSEQLKSSSFFNSSLGRSKRSEQNLYFDSRLQEKVMEIPAQSVYIYPNFNKSKQKIDKQKDYITAKIVKEAEQNQESLLLDLSSNLNNTKSSNEQIRSSYAQIPCFNEEDPSYKSKAKQQQKRKFNSNERLNDKKQGKADEKQRLNEKQSIPFQKQTKNVLNKIFIEDLNKNGVYKCHQSSSQSTKSNSRILKSKYYQINSKKFYV